MLMLACRTATPFTVLKLLKVTISSCSVALSDTSGMEVIKASMNSSSVQSKFYPKTIEANVQIGEIKAWSFDDELLTSNMKSVGKRDVLDLHLIHSPQVRLYSLGLQSFSPWCAFGYTHSLLLYVSTGWPS
jgi:hypothetical protein